MALNVEDQITFAVLAATVDMPSGTFGDATGTSRATIHPLLQIGRTRQFSPGSEHVFAIDTRMSTRDAYDGTIAWQQVQVHGWGVYLVDGAAAPVPVPTWKPDPDDAVYLRTTTIGKAWPMGRHTGVVYLNVATTNMPGVAALPFSKAGGWPTTDWRPQDLLATAYRTGEQYLGFHGRVVSKDANKLQVEIFRRGKQQPAATLWLDPANQADMDPNPPANVTVGDKQHSIAVLTLASKIDDQGGVFVNIERLIKHPIVTERMSLIATPKLPFWLEQ